MKKLLFAMVTVLALFAACKENDHQEPICPTVDAELVPSIVKDSLAAHYPDVVVETWFKVDTLGFCAKFPQAPNTVFAHFGTDGTFLEVEVHDANGKEVDADNQQEEHHGDNKDGEDTCECR